MPIHHVLMALLVAVVWGFNFVVIKIGLKEVPPFAFAFLRYAFAGLPLLIFIKRPPLSLGLLTAIGLTMGFIKFAFLFVGIDLGITSGLGSLILQSQAFFTIILSIFVLNYRLTIQHIVGISIAFIGIFLIGLEMNTEANLLGLICILCAAFSWAVSNILVKKAGPVNPFALIVWTSLIPPLPFLGISYMFEGNNHVWIEIWQKLTWVGFVCILYISWIATWLGGSLWAKLMGLYPPSTVVPYSLLIPVFAFLSGWLFLGETITLQTTLACSLIFVGLIINQWPRPNKNVPRALRTESKVPSQAAA